ncbi:hypothetical protein [Streptomyces sp. NPDC093269]|uniref:hypothetical protein n=1 Tax=Streptomyces sp. NPDC093269 TaxID=3366038 RepID=UPI003803D5E0
MNTLTVEQRGDLAEQMLPVAAHLAVLVHGDGGPEDVQDVLAGLTDTQKNALLIVLAGLVDPEQKLGKALGWLDFNEHGALTVPESWSERRSVRDLAPESDEELDSDYVDPSAVARFVKGFRVDVTDADFLAAVPRCAALGMTCPDIDALRGWAKGTTENWINRLKKRYQRSGRPFPDLGFSKAALFTREKVVAIRERSAAGTSDVILAVEYDVDRETIRSIVRGQRYAKYGGPIRRAQTDGAVQASREYMTGHHPNSKAAKPLSLQPKNAILTPQDRDAIRQRTAGGEDVKDLATEFQVSASIIRDYAA